MLNATQLSFSLNLIQADFSSINISLLSPLVNTRHKFSAYLENFEKCIYIFNVSSHWIVLQRLSMTDFLFFSSISNENYVFLLDKIFDQFFSFMKSNDSCFFKIVAPFLYQQKGSLDCGLFSLAYCYSLCSLKTLTKTHYKQDKMRDHFNLCLEKKKFCNFPSNLSFFGERRKKTFNYDCKLKKFC